MKKINKLLTSLLLASTFFFIITCYASKPITDSKDNSPLSPMLERVMPAVVNIAARGELPLNHPMRKKLNTPPRFEGLGSGVIIDAKNGYIITNTHVIKDSNAITVTLRDGRSMVAKIIGYDIASDIAVIQIKERRLTSIPFGDSDKLRVGNSVAAIGSPFGLQQTATAGIISGLERSGFGQSYESFIQTDAPINTGNSGGALVNMKGELVGINTAIISPVPVSAGIGLTVPSNIAKNVAKQLIETGVVRRGMVGINAQDITSSIAEAMKLKNPKGALVTEVYPDTPAQKAGIKNKDVIVKIMDKPVHSAIQISNTTSLMPIGSEVKLQIQRNNKLINTKVKTVDPDKFRRAALDAPKALLSGLKLKNFHQLVSNELIKGVEVSGIDDASIAYSCGLRSSDVILIAADQPVRSIEELQKVAKKNHQQLLLEIRRNESGKLFLVLEE